MDDIIEEVFGGFCKALNESRTVFCEFARGEDGKLRLDNADCAYGACPHTEVLSLIHI